MQQASTSMGDCRANFMMVFHTADSDRKRLQDTLAGSFMPASEQDMGFSGGGMRRSVGLSQPAADAPRTAASSSSHQAAGPSSTPAVAAFLGSISGRFSSGGVIQPEAAGLQKPSSTQQVWPSFISPWFYLAALYFIMLQL